MKYSIKTVMDRLKTARVGASRAFVNPSREWGIGLLIGVLVLVVGMVYASTLFYSASDETETSALVPATVSPLPYRAQEVRAVLEVYEARARAFTEMQGALLPEAPASVGESESSQEAEEIPTGAPVAE